MDVHFYNGRHLLVDRELDSVPRDGETVTFAEVQSKATGEGMPFQGTVEDVVWHDNRGQFHVCVYLKPSPRPSATQS